MKSFFGLLAALVLLSGCTPDPIVVVVPDSGTVLPEINELQAVSTDDFATDVVAEREGLAEGLFDPEFDEFPLEIFPYVELKNESLTTIYSFTVSGVVYDEDGSVWFPDVNTPELLIGPGERVVLVESAFSRASSFPSEVEFSYDALSARPVSEEEVGSLTAEGVDWTSGDFGEFTVSGKVVNPMQVTVDAVAIYGWCTATDGKMYGAQPSYLYPPEGTLESGQSKAFQLIGYTSSRAEIDSCEVSVVRSVAF